jgi:hypothetical protein
MTTNDNGDHDNNEHTNKIMITIVWFVRSLRTIILVTFIDVVCVATLVVDILIITLVVDNLIVATLVDVAVVVVDEWFIISPSLKTFSSSLPTLRN